MNDSQHTLFSGRNLSNFLIKRWEFFTKERETSTYDASLSRYRYILRLPELDLSKITISKWGETKPQATDFLSYGDYLNATISHLESMLENQHHTYIIVSIPFEGDSNLLRYRSSNCNLPVPQGRLGDEPIQMRFERNGSKDEEWKTLFERDVAAVNASLKSSDNSLCGVNENVRKSNS